MLEAMEDELYEQARDDMVRLSDAGAAFVFLSVAPEAVANGHWLHLDLVHDLIRELDADAPKRVQLAAAVLMEFGFGEQVTVSELLALEPDDRNVVLAGLLASGIHA